MYIAFGIWLLAASVWAFCAYGADKRRAKKRQRRIPEKNLLWLGFLGGAAGALMGMSLFRHKTKHGRFWVVNLLGLIWQSAVLCTLWLTLG